jgi:hypothetical protein
VNGLAVVHDLRRRPPLLIGPGHHDGGARLEAPSGQYGVRQGDVLWCRAGLRLQQDALLRNAMLDGVLAITHCLAAGIPLEFPWVGVLPSADVKQFVQDFANAVLAAAELQRWQIVDETVSEWKATAAIHADPALRKRLTGAITDDLGPVPSPVDEAADGSDREPTG